MGGKPGKVDQLEVHKGGLRGKAGREHGVQGGQNVETHTTLSGVGWSADGFQILVTACPCHGVGNCGAPTAHEDYHGRIVKHTGCQDDHNGQTIHCDRNIHLEGRASE